MSVIADIQQAIRRRKRNRDRKRRLKQGHKAKREARAVRRLRRRIALLLAPRTMFDAVTVGNLPKNARAVAGYVNGNYTTFPLLAGLFPKARRVSIAVSSSADADVLDVEAGDATNDEAAAWYRRHKGNRRFYTSASNIRTLLAALHAAGLHVTEDQIWSAHYDGKHICGPHTCGYADAPVGATQFTTHEETLDESIVRPAFWDRG